MKLEVLTASREGFLSGLVLRGENDIQLKMMADLLWISKEARKVEVQKFCDFVDEIVAHGIEVGDWPQIKERILANKATV